MIKGKPKQTPALPLASSRLAASLRAPRMDLPRQYRLAHVNNHCIGIQGSIETRGRLLFPGDSPALACRKSDRNDSCFSLLCKFSHQSLVL